MTVRRGALNTFLASGPFVESWELYISRTHTFLRWAELLCKHVPRSLNHNNKLKMY